ncbi:MAG: hypothetical protein ABI878_11730 [Acidobacteriota bacterium]
MRIILDAILLFPGDWKLFHDLYFASSMLLVSARRDGKWMHYSIRPRGDKAAAEVFDATMKMLDKDKQMREDRRRFIGFVCVPNSSVIIHGRAAR